jgi:L-lactate permease
VDEEQASGASAITSTVQQMAISFGIATASLVAGFFVHDQAHADSAAMIHGIHDTFLILGGYTMVSAIVFRELKKEDGDTVSQHKSVEHVE